MTKARLLYLILVVSAIFFFILYIDMLSMIVLLLVLLLPLLLLLATAIASVGIRLNIEAPVSAAVKDQGAVVNIQIENFSFVPVTNARLTLSYTNNFSNSEQTEFITVPIHANNKQKISFQIVSSHCGDVSICLKRVQLYDFFKLFCIRRKINKCCDIVFMPEVDDLDLAVTQNSNYISESNVYSKHKSGDDPSEVFAIRDYAGGDKMNRIHWKLSSKMDELLVKDYSLPVSHSLLILVELYSNMEDPNRLEVIDTMIEAACSLSLYMARHEMVHYVGWYSAADGLFHKEKVEYEEDVYAVLGHLLRAKAYAEGAYSLRYQRKTDIGSRYSHILYITPVMNESLLTECSELQRTAELTVLRAADAKELPQDFSNAPFELIPIYPGEVRVNLRRLAL